jgi:hypothetical protein
VVVHADAVTVIDNVRTVVITVPPGGPYKGACLRKAQQRHLLNA